MTDLSMAELEQASGGGLRDITFGAMSLLSALTGDPAGDKIDPPDMTSRPAITQTLEPPKAGTKPSLLPSAPTPGG